MSKRNSKALKPETTKLTIRLPRERVEFVKRFAKEHDVTVTEVFNRYLEKLQADTPEELHPELQRMVGIIPPDIDVDKLRYQYLVEKYGPWS